MNGSTGKAISVIAVAAAVIVAAWTVMRISDNKTAVARAEAAKAASAESEAKALSNAKDKEAKTAEQNAIAAEHAAKKAEEDRKAAEAKAAAEKSAAERAALERETALATKATAQANAAKAASDADAEQAKAVAAKAEAERVRVQAKADEKAAETKLAIEQAETERARLVAERTANERRTLELKRENLLEVEHQLMLLKQDLDEREAALRPEMTIKDLVTTSEDEKDEKVTGPVLPENDPNLPRESRELARAERLHSEQLADAAERNRKAVVVRLERLYVEAIREDRVTDADFYRKELKRLYPDWVYTPPKSGSDELNEEAKEEEK